MIEELIIESVRNDVARIGEDLRLIAQRVIEEGISEYPVFIAAQDHVDIGKPVFDRDEVQLNWFFFASVLEDFVKRGIVARDRIRQFKRAYDDPMEKACILVLTPEDIRFIFVPYDIEADDTDIGNMDADED